MEITKFGHSCVLLDNGSTKILFDPGIYSNIPSIAVDAILITHIHQDHCDIEKIKNLLNINKDLRIITNSEVQSLLLEQGINSEIVEAGAMTKINNISISGQGTTHAIMHPTLPVFQNTGYSVTEQVFHPGDALTIPVNPVEVLLLPIAAPWSKLEETLDYISAVKPAIVFPIHDGFLKDGGAFYRLSKQWCDTLGIKFIEPELEKIYGI